MLLQVFRYGNGATCTTANASLAYSCGQYYTIEAASADKSIVDQTDEEAWATCCSVVSLWMLHTGSSVTVSHVKSDRL